jgi:hypothetical protein
MTEDHIPGAHRITRCPPVQIAMTAFYILRGPKRVGGKQPLLDNFPCQTHKGRVLLVQGASNQGDPLAKLVGAV